MRLDIFAMAVFLMLALSGSAKTIYVPDDYTTIQAAIHASVDGDAIIVRPGTYVENIDFLGKAVTVESSDGPSVTMIDGNQSGNVVKFQMGEGPDSVLEGFTIRNGKTWISGGGIYCSNASPTIQENVITENGNSFGGIYCEYGSPSILNNIIVKNSGDTAGGITCSWGASPLIAFNRIQDNTGCGIYCEEDCGSVIHDNIIAGNQSSGRGGGIFCYSMYGSPPDPTIINNVIHGNTAKAYGGGISCVRESPDIYFNIITGNTAEQGGGISCTGSPFYGEGHLRIIGNIIATNIANEQGGGIHCVLYGGATIRNNTLAENTADKGGGLSCLNGFYATVVDSIFCNNQASTAGPEIYIGDDYWGSSVTIGYSDLTGGLSSVYVATGCTLHWGSGMIDADPLFVDPTDGDFHLTCPSPCKDTGDNTSVIEPFDFEGDPRIAYGTVDMGADEFHTHLYWTGDGMPGGSAALKFVGLPGTSPVQLWLGSGVMDPPLPTKYGDWYLQFPLLFQLGLGSIPSPDGVFILPFTFPPDTPTPLSMFFQAGIGTELTNLCVLEVE